MFVSDTHLPQLLPAVAYHGAAWHEREMERVLLPAWWAVAVTDELPRAGSFITFDHVGGPVILRRGDDGVIRGYRNVCAHRLAKLTGKAHGCCAALTCEYHGWEYDDTGATRRIPDAPSFRPLEKSRLGLDMLRAETIGKVVFLSFAAAGPGGREWLGPKAERIARDFDDATATVWREDVTLPVNWKLVVENNLESYHVGTVHARSLGSYPEEAACLHGLFSGGSRFEAPGDPSAWGRLKRAVARNIGRPADGRYVHVHLHPAFMRVEVDLGVGFQSVVPTGPRSFDLARTAEEVA
jgi:choline monooxygenase